MEGPDELEPGVEPDEGEAQERRLGEGERRVPVALPPLFEAALLLLRREAAPVELLPGEGDLLADGLQGLLEPIPEKGRAQHRRGASRASPRPAGRAGCRGPPAGCR